MSKVEDERGEQLLSAVERLLADSDQIAAYVEAQRATLPTSDSHSELGELLIRRYASTSAAAGAAAAAPAMLPGFGTFAALTGGALVDITALLKVETELALALAHAWGFDIHRVEERRFALALASVSTYRDKRGDDVGDFIEIEGTALFNYGPRHLAKLLTTVLARLAMLSMGRGMLRAIPFAGMAVGASMNNLLTKRVGERMHAAIIRRREQVDAGHEAVAESGAEADGDGIVEARILGPGGES